MRRFLRKRFPGLRSLQSGFTLVELIVVVGIIVALAAVIIPNVASFSGKGETAAQESEMDNVQTSMDTMMSDKNLTSVTKHSSGDGSSVNDFSVLPSVSNALQTYLRLNTGDLTKYFYCWDGTGLVYQQHTTATTCP